MVKIAPNPEELIGLGVYTSSYADTEPSFATKHETKSRVNDLLHQFSSLKEEESKREANKKAPGIFERLMEYSKPVFSRESLYRGFVDVFAEDIPSLAAAATRNWTFFKEDLFKLTISTSMMFAAPLLTHITGSSFAKQFFGEEAHNFKNYLLFSNEDLTDLDSFKNARIKIAEREIKDKLNQVKVNGARSRAATKIEKQAKDIADFALGYRADDKLRERIINFKAKIIQTTTLLESSFWGLRPFIERLFRKYVLGIDRFSGSLKYLSDKDADKLGNIRGFTFKQVLGTLLAIVSSPLAITALISSRGGKDQTINKNLDYNHSLYPKFWLYGSQRQIPLLTSKIFNSQDPFELLENIIRFVITAASLFFGDRATNGRFAKQADQKLTSKYQVEPGILYHTPKYKGIAGKLEEWFPEAAKFDHVLDRTESNPKLAQEASDKYKTTFFKGFLVHSIGTFLLKFSLYRLMRVFTLYRLKKAEN